MSTKHVLRWVGAEAFVAGGGQPGDIRPGPALLRFDGDDFMDRMLALLAEQPQNLPELVAKAENWQEIGDPTPLPPSLAPTDKPLSRPARALARARELVAFRRRNRPPRSPLMTPQAIDRALTEARPLKLFQPVHQRYYLAAAHLVCELPGLPPRVTATGDRSGFVIRRLVGPSGQAPSRREYGFVKDASGHGRWLEASHPDADTVPGEELLPLFPLAYTPPAGPPRRLLAGTIPVARHDEYRFAGRASAAGQAAEHKNARAINNARALARMKVIAPWQSLIERAYQSGGASIGLTADTPWQDDEPPPSATANTLKTTNDQLVEASWRLLQDMREFLLASFTALTGEVLTSGNLERHDRPQLQALLDFLGQTTWTAPPAEAPDEDRPQLSDDVLDLADPYAHASLLAALAALDEDTSQKLDGFEQAFPAGTGWPGWAFPLVYLLGGLPEMDTVILRNVPRLRGPFRDWTLPELTLPDGTVVPESRHDADNRRLELLFERLAAAIAEAGEAEPSELRADAQAPSAAQLASEIAASLVDEAGPPRYLVRFVHRRCDCGPLHPPVISAPSEVFELAGFFDSEAPMRPIRIALPFDTTPGGLRKFGKNSAFIMSDVLCGQMKRIRRLGFGDLVLSVLPWPFHKDLDVAASGPCSDPGGRFGTICSLSIPIITIVAFVLLIVIATLLDLIFRWLPFLIACFPVPGLKGKNK